MIPLVYSYRSLVARWRTVGAGIGGIALATALLCGGQMIVRGAGNVMGRSGAPDVAVVVASGAESESGSTIDESAIGRVAHQATGGARFLGKDVVVLTLLPKVGTESEGQVAIRGTSSLDPGSRPGFRVVEGRAPTAGDEVVIGRAIRGRLRGLELGQTFDIGDRPVRVVGVFSSEGSAFESEVWGDLAFIQAATGSRGTVSSGRVKLSTAADFAGFKVAVEQERLPVTVVRESEFYEKQADGLRPLLAAVTALIMLFFSIASILGTTMTMHSVMAERRREIVLLRVLGFLPRSIFLSTMVESFGLGLVGGGLGVLASYPLSAARISMINFVTYTEIVFGFEMTVSIAVVSIVFACTLAVLGSLLPAKRAIGADLRSGLRA